MHNLSKSTEAWRRLSLRAESRTFKNRTDAVRHQASRVFDDRRRNDTPLAEARFAEIAQLMRENRAAGL